MGLLNYIPELDENGLQVNRTAATGYGVVNPGVPATEPVYYGKPKAAEPGKKRKMNPWTMAGLGLLGGIWAQHNPQGFHAAMGAMGQGLQRQQEMELKREQERQEAEWRDRQAERWDDDRISRETTLADRLALQKEIADARARIQEMTQTGIDPVTGMPVKYAVGSLPWAREQTAENRTTTAETQRMGLLGTDLQGNAIPMVPGSAPWLRQQQGENTQARTATEEARRIPGVNLLNEQVAGLANKNAVTGNPTYQQGQINAQPLRNTHQEQVNDTFLAQNAAKTALLLAQITKALREPAPRGTGGGRTPSPPRPKPKPTTMTEREAARLAAAYPGQPPKVAKQMEQEGFAKGLPFEVSLATEGYWTEDKRTAYPTQFKYDQNALEIINASVASGVSKAQTMKRLADAGLLVKTLIGPGTQATARQNYEKIYDWIMKANGKTAPIPNFSKGGPFSPEDDMRKLAEQRVNGL